MTYLHVLHGAGDDLFAEVHNPLLEQVPDPLVGVLQRGDLCLQVLNRGLAQLGLVLLLQVVVDVLDDLGGDAGQEADQVVVVHEVLEEDVHVLLDGLLDPLAVHGDDEAVEVGEAEQDHGRGDTHSFNLGEVGGKID